MKAVVAFVAFDGNCTEAMEFYRKCLDAELYTVPFSEGRLRSATLMKGSNMILKAADTVPESPFQPSGSFAVAVHCESLRETEKLFAALGEEGEVTSPLHATCRGAGLGAQGELTDKFGVRWLFSFMQSE